MTMENTDVSIMTQNSKISDEVSMKIIAQLEVTTTLKGRRLGRLRTTVLEVTSIYP